MNPDEIDRFRHMRDAATAAVNFAAGKGRVDLDNDLMLQFDRYEVPEQKVCDQVDENISAGRRVDQRHP